MRGYITSLIEGCTSAFSCIRLHPSRRRVLLLLAWICVIFTINLNSIFKAGTTPMCSTRAQNRHLVCQRQKMMTPITCGFPDFDPWEPTLHKFTKRHAPIDCSAGLPIVVYTENGVLKLNKSKLLKTGTKVSYCNYTTIEMEPGSDTSVRFSKESWKFEDSKTLRQQDKDIFVKCFNDKDTLVFQSGHSIISPRPELEAERKPVLQAHLREHKIPQPLNVLLFGIESMSQHNFIRMMPKTRQFVLSELKAIEMEKFIRVGDSTISNVVPLLTGKQIDEFQNGEVPGYEQLDSHGAFDGITEAFLWSDFEKAGYRSAYAWDENHVTAFHYLRKGWLKRQVDYTNRPTAVATQTGEAGKQIRSKGNNCINDVPEVEVSMKYTEQFATTFNGTETPYFGYMFLTRLTHDDLNVASEADDCVLRHFQRLRDKNLLTNTVLYFFSDHGFRMGGIQTTFAGAFERETPFAFLILPEWFSQTYPDVIGTLRINAKRLTTHYDVYATLKDILYFSGQSKVHNVSRYGVSIFQEIPPSRSCEDAGIPAVHCVCQKPSQKLDVKSSEAVKISQALVAHINKLTLKVEDKCSRLELDTINAVQCSENMGQPKSKPKLCRVIIETVPGKALFEATMLVYSDGRVPEAHGKVLRNSLYKGQSECVEDVFLRNYCYCKKKISKEPETEPKKETSP